MDKSVNVGTLNLYLTFSILNNAKIFPPLFHDFSFNYTLPKNSSKFLKYFLKMFKKNLKKFLQNVSKISTNFH